MVTATDLCYVPTGARPTPRIVFSHFDEQIMFHRSISSPSSYGWVSRNRDTVWVSRTPKSNWKIYIVTEIEDNVELREHRHNARREEKEEPYHEECIPDTAHGKPDPKGHFVEEPYRTVGHVTPVKVRIQGVGGQQFTFIAR